MTAADELREKIAAGRVVVFCGAGVAHATNPAAPGPDNPPAGRRGELATAP